MTELARLEAVLHDLALPEGQWVVSGSGVLVLSGIERTRPMGDVDVFVATRTWFETLEDGGWDVWTTAPDDPARRADPPYLRRVMHDFEVNLFFQWRFRDVGNIDVNQRIAEAVHVRGWPCMPLSYMLAWKKWVGREKDMDDIRLLERCVERGAA